MLALKIENVSKIFKDKNKVTTALDNVSLHINQGEIFGLLGPNGAGKTTLISIIAGLLQHETGAIEVFQYPLKENRQKIKQMINIVPGFTHLASSLTIDEFLREYSLLYEVKDWKKKKEQLIKLLELEGKRDDELRTLSSGYKQRALLAKALLTNPKLLLMDEPTVGLDVDIAIKMRGIIKRLKQQGYTILLTTHNMFEVEELCDRIALIRQGKIVVVGTIDEVKKLIIEKNGIEIECENPRKVKRLLEKEKYVQSIKDLPNGCIVYVDQYRRIKTLMKQLSLIEEKIYTIRIVEPTLEEAFIKLTRGKKK